MKEFGPDSDLNNPILPKNSKSSENTEVKPKTSLIKYLIIFAIILSLIVIALIIMNVLPSDNSDAN